MNLATKGNIGCDKRIGIEILLTRHRELKESGKEVCVLHSPVLSLFNLRALFMCFGDQSH